MLHQHDINPLDLDLPQRSVTLWNLINSNLGAAEEVPQIPAELLEIIGGYGVCWRCPFVEGKAPTDEEVFNLLLDIYEATGRIIVDGIGKGNIKVDQDGVAHCVDIGMALQLEKAPSPLHIHGRQSRERSHSIPSESFWEKMEKKFDPYFKGYEKTKP